MCPDITRQRLTIYLQIPYRRYYRSVLASTFEMYLAILRLVNTRVKQALGHDTPDWRVLNACPPCTYKLEGEPPRTFNRTMAFDGNNSMKRLYKLGDRRVQDMRPFTESDYLLSPEYVDQYKDEVKSRRGPAVPDDNSDEDMGGEYTAQDPNTRPECTTKFRAAAADYKKTTWGIFEETGWFVSACRHSLILWFCDMLRSGELLVNSMPTYTMLC